MTWYALAIISAFLAALNSLLQRTALKNKSLDPVTYSIYFQLFISLIFLTIALFQGGNFGNFTIRDAFHYTLLAFLYGVGNFLVFYALSKIEASRFVILFSARALFSFLGFYFISQVTTSVESLFGILFTLVGIIIVNLEGLSIKFSKYDLTAVLAGIFYGLATVNDRYLLDRFELYPYLFLAFLLPALLTALVRPKALFDLTLFKSVKLLTPVLLSVVFYTISSVVFFYALKIATDPSKVVGINMTNILITVLGTYFFLSEKSNFGRKLLGAAFCLLGLYLAR